MRVGVGDGAVEGIWPARGGVAVAFDFNLDTDGTVYTCRLERTNPTGPMGCVSLAF
jgi:hypothetical protein